MPLTLAHIPDSDQAAPGAPATSVLSAVRGPARRRTVLRAMTLGALTIGAVAAEWSGRLVPTRAARAGNENGPNGLTGWTDTNNCRDAFPAGWWPPTGQTFTEGYNAEADTGGSYASYPYPAACFGGSFRSSGYCSSGWHRSGSALSGGVVYTYTPISSMCGRPMNGTKNAWRWATTSSPIGTRVWRCSDGRTRAGSGSTYYTVCRAQLS
jgi:hypothetical protein